MSHSPSFFRNKILRSLTGDDLENLAPKLKFVSLAFKEVLEEPFSPVEYVYFVEQGLVSIVTMTLEKSGVEVAVVGPEGITGTSILFGVDRTPLKSFVQIEGSAYRLPAFALTQAISNSPELSSKLFRYSHSLFLQAAEAVYAAGRYTIPQRLARWLLMAHDRTQNVHIDLTHDVLAIMLGVQRPRVTDAVAVLEGRGIIKANRGNIVIRDRAKLIEMAGGSYSPTGHQKAERASTLSAGRCWIDSA